MALLSPSCLVVFPPSPILLEFIPQAEKHLASTACSITEMGNTALSGLRTLLDWPNGQIKLFYIPPPCPCHMRGKQFRWYNSLWLLIRLGDHRSLLSLPLLIGLGATLAIPPIALFILNFDQSKTDLPIHVNLKVKLFILLLAFSFPFLCLWLHRSASGPLITMEELDKGLPTSWNEKEPQYDARAGNRSMWRRYLTGIIALLMLLLFTLALGLGLGLGLSLKDVGSGTDVIIDLGYSKYSGKAFSDGTSQWLGMRYAAAPVEQLRFAAPRDAPPTDRVQPAVAVSRRASMFPRRLTERHRKVPIACQLIPR